MYRERLVATDVHTENAHRLKRLLLEYHDFRQHKAGHPLRDVRRRGVELHVRRDGGLCRRDPAERLRRLRARRRRTRRLLRDVWARHRRVRRNDARVQR